MIRDDAKVTRDEFMGQMHQRKVGTGVHYRALHVHPYYAERFGYVPEQFPNAYWVGERTVSIPLTQKLTDREVERVIAAVRGILS
jgi:dTDP-4-amino-4,6-dideoxygalactose transaminase